MLIWTDIIALVATGLVFSLGQFIQKKTGLIVLNPILFSMVLLIVIIQLSGWNYASYHHGARYIEWLLKPAVVALGLPLYQNLKTIKKQAIPILVSHSVGCILALTSVILIARSMHAPKALILSLAPKSVSSAFALGIAESIGGIPALAAAIAICIGLIGALFAYPLLALMNIRNPISQSLSVGLAAHGIGTARSLQFSNRFAAFSTLAFILNGILTSLLAPWLVKWLLG